MSVHLTPIEYSQEECTKIILTNVLKMISERGLIDKSKLESHINTLTSKYEEETHVIPLDKEYDKYNEINIIMFNQKISAATHSSEIGDYLYKNANKYKIIIADSIASRARQTIQNSFQNIEVFTRDELMFNLIDHVYVPKHELLSNEEAEKVINEYGAQKKMLPRIFASDPVARYYNAKVGQVFRIIRPSELSGYSNYYRLVIKAVSTKKSK